MANAHRLQLYSVVHLLWEQRLLSLLKNEGNFDQVPFTALLDDIRYNVGEGRSFYLPLDTLCLAPKNLIAM